MRFAWCVLIVAALLLSGCQQRSIVGTWVSSDRVTTVTLAEDGSVSGTVMRGPFPVAFTAQYRYEGSVLTIQKMDVPLLKFAPREARRFVDRNMSGVVDLQVAWKDAKSIELTGGGLFNGKFVRQP